MSIIDEQPVETQMAAQFERVIRRVKQSMNYRGSYSTQDILGSLVARWLQSGEWERLREIPAPERRIGESVRRFILDRLNQLRRRGARAEVVEDQLQLPDDATMLELVELTRLRTWIEQRIGELERDEVDHRVRIPLARRRSVGQALRMHIEGNTQRQISDALGISLGSVNKRLIDGTNYLVVLHSVECERPGDG
ncbi:hypothetical protein BH11MYX3_BH11MYX3_40910 [soil metagenome]